MWPSRLNSEISFTVTVQTIKGPCQGTETLSNPRVLPTIPNHIAAGKKLRIFEVFLSLLRTTAR
jgi:hypothetical protein